MSYQKEIFSIISSLVGESNLFVIPKVFIEITGSFETALFLSQLIYWSDKVGRSDGYMYKTMEEWQRELMITPYALKKARSYLKEQGILKEKIKKANGNPTVHYKVDHEALISWFHTKSHRTNNVKTDESN